MQILCSSSNWAPEWERGDSSDCESDRLWLQNLLNCWDFPTRPSLCLKKRKYPVSASTHEENVRRQRMARLKLAAITQINTCWNQSTQLLISNCFQWQCTVLWKVSTVTKFQTTRASLGCGGNWRVASWTWRWINLQQRRTKISDLCFQHPVGTKNLRKQRGSKW